MSKPNPQGDATANGQASASSSSSSSSASASSSSSLPPSSDGDGPGMAHQRAGYERPSMWQAPQSLLYPTSALAQKRFTRKGGPREVSQARKDVYFRRVAMPHRWDGPPPAQWQRNAQLAAGLLSGAVGVYMLFFLDYGPQPNAIADFRTAIGWDKLNPLKLSAEEKEWAIREREQANAKRLAREALRKETERQSAADGQPSRLV